MPIDCCLQVRIAVFWLTLNIADVSSQDHGFVVRMYCDMIHNDCTAPTDENDFCDAISITRQTRAICSNSAGATITVSASGPGTLSYAWKKDGDIITSENFPQCSGFDSDTLTISPFTILDEGNYSCVISNEEGLSTESELITVKGMQKWKGAYFSLSFTA